MKEGTEAIRHRAEDMTDEVKKKIKIFELKQKIQVQLTELGGRVYEVVSEGKRRNPILDENVKKIFDRIKKIEDQISKLEGKIGTKKAKKGPTKKRKPRSSKKGTVKKASTDRRTTRGRTKKS